MVDKNKNVWSSLVRKTSLFPSARAHMCECSPVSLGAAGWGMGRKGSPPLKKFSTGSQSSHSDVPVLSEPPLMCQSALSWIVGFLAGSQHLLYADITICIPKSLNVIYSKILLEDLLPAKDCFVLEIISRNKRGQNPCSHRGSSVHKRREGLRNPRSSSLLHICWILNLVG